MNTHYQYELQYEYKQYNQYNQSIHFLCELKVCALKKLLPQIQSHALRIYLLCNI